MPVRPRGSMRGGVRRSLVMRKMDERLRRNAPKSWPRGSRLRSNVLRARKFSPKRGSHSPRPTRKTTLLRSQAVRRISPPRKRMPFRKERDDLRIPPKRPRTSSKSRSKSPRQPPAPPRERLSYSDRDEPREKPRIRTPEKKPTYEGSSKEYLKEDLSKIERSVTRDFYSSKRSTDVNRKFIPPENITIIRRLGEGSTRIFDREEIIKYREKYGEPDVNPPHSDRTSFDPPSSYSDDFRSRDYYPEKDKFLNNSRRSPREYDYRGKDDRYQPSTSRGRSYDRSRDYSQDRRDRYDDRELSRGPRRSLDRGLRRNPSPVDSRRHMSQYKDFGERKARSVERRDVEPTHHRDQDYPPGDRYSSMGHPKGRSYYEHDGKDAAPSSSRGRGSGFYPRGRGKMVPGRPFIRSAASHFAPLPPFRGRGAPVPRVSFIGRPLAPRKSFRGSFQGRR